MINNNLEYIDLCRERRQCVTDRDRAMARIDEIDEWINGQELRNLEADDNGTD